jgi:hypothetical protein
MYKYVIFLILQSHSLTAASPRQCFTCRSRGELGDCRDPFPFNATTGIGQPGLKLVPCPSGWCGKTIEGVRGPPDGKCPGFNSTLPGRRQLICSIFLNYKLFVPKNNVWHHVEVKGEVEVDTYIHFWPNFQIHLLPDFGTATERTCLSQAPPDGEERCAELRINNKVSLLCVCRGTLCNEAPGPGRKGSFLAVLLSLGAILRHISQ